MSAPFPRFHPDLFPTCASPAQAAADRVLATKPTARARSTLEAEWTAGTHRLRLDGRCDLSHHDRSRVLNGDRPPRPAGYWNWTPKRSATYVLRSRSVQRLSVARPLLASRARSHALWHIMTMGALPISLFERPVVAAGGAALALLTGRCENASRTAHAIRAETAHFCASDCIEDLGDHWPAFLSFLGWMALQLPRQSTIENRFAFTDSIEEWNSALRDMHIKPISQQRADALQRHLDAALNRKTTPEYPFWTSAQQWTTSRLQCRVTFRQKERYTGLRALAQRYRNRRRARSGSGASLGLQRSSHVFVRQRPRLVRAHARKHIYRRQSARACPSRICAVLQRGIAEWNDICATWLSVVLRRRSPVHDIDLFLTSLDPDTNLQTLRTVWTHLRETVPIHLPIRCLRTAHSVTFACPAPYPTVQVILKPYASVTDVLASFDLDVTAVAFDGRRLVSARAHRALVYGYNVCAANRMSQTYEERLVKYLHRGVGVAPGQGFTPAHLCLRSSAPHGLSRFLRLLECTRTDKDADADADANAEEKGVDEHSTSSDHSPSQIRASARDLERVSPLHIGDGALLHMVERLRIARSVGPTASKSKSTESDLEWAVLGPDLATVLGTRSLWFWRATSPENRLCVYSEETGEPFAWVQNNSIGSFRPVLSAWLQ